LQPLDDDYFPAYRRPVRGQEHLDAGPTHRKAA
jgi:hypothetical protein